MMRVLILLSMLAMATWGPLTVLAERTLNIVNKCPRPIAVYINGESQGSIPSGGTAAKNVTDDWEGFVYSNVNAPEGNTGSGSTKAALVGKVSTHRCLVTCG